jgi:hypothetical protein
MSRETAHTPTPWKQGIVATDAENIYGPSDEIVASCEDTSVYRRTVTTEARENANAEFIVRACNSHEALLARVAAHVAACECGGTGRRKGRPAWDPPGKTSPIVEFDCDYCAADRAALKAAKP